MTEEENHSHQASYPVLQPLKPSKPNEGDKQCPYPWIKELAHDSIENCLIKGDIASFYELWSEESKKCMSFADFGRTLAQMGKIYGKFTRVGDVSEPKEENGGFWSVVVDLYVDDIEFFANVSFNEIKELGHFQYGRKCIYHPPEYIKPARFEHETVKEKDPFILLSKPTKVGNQFPCALLVHTMIEYDINVRMGYCFPARDFEYLSSANIGLLRSTFSEEMINNGDPILNHATKLMEAVLMRDDVSKVFLILHSYASMLIGTILKKFSGIVSGVIVISPRWNAPEGSPLVTLKEEDLPKDIPILAIAGGYDTIGNPEDFKIWESALKKIGRNCESVLYDTCDHFMLACPNKPVPGEYSIFEKHVSDVPLRKIAQFIRAHSE
ncbi:hypothetical protein TRFO_30904 [Tritrichomonas foetus]|uniref:Uncharacterized protein n=1 Tax=Tritrichomonas foetus TaxID=1144522 RepID=A0A1J4JXZ0_9EUKA|nr:hypothetical protein TRFO_30904 [Tritrichomonas foetus]|eukprot:OHT02141.1 hypothetical protein TRFO_30904 [Tritrichomonas foetus]